MRMLLLMPLAGLAACTEVAPEPPPAPVEAAPPAASAAEVTAAPASAPVPAPSDRLTAEGWGPLRIGMTQAEVTRALGEDAQPGAVGGPESEACDQYRPARAPEGMLVMLEDGRLTRISLIRDSKVRTDRGLGLHATPAEVRATYGASLTASPHKYVDAPAEYLDAWAGGRPSVPFVEDTDARGIRYEVGGEGRVTAIHAGGPAIQYVEGCA